MTETRYAEMSGWSLQEFLMPREWFGRRDRPEYVMQCGDEAFTAPVARWFRVGENSLCMKARFMGRSSGMRLNTRDCLHEECFPPCTFDSREQVEACEYGIEHEAINGATT